MTQTNAGPGARNGEVFGGLPVELVEFSFHNGVVANLLFAITRFSSVGFHIRWRVDSKWREEVPFDGPEVEPFVSDASKSTVLASVAFYMRILRRIHKKTILWISTGPESRVVPDLLFLLLLIGLRGRSMVLSIRNLERWLRRPEERSLQDYLRSRVIHFVPRLVFESEVQRSRFAQEVPAFKGRTAVLPVFFSDASRVWATDISRRAPLISGEIRLGLLGGLDEEKRNYRPLLEALAMLDEAERNRLVVSVLGFSNIEGPDPVLASLGKLAKVETFGRYISNKTLVLEMRRCFVLVAPLRDGLGYGEFKGTGSIGDALLSHRIVMLPAEVPVDTEIKTATIPYGSAEELYRLLVLLITRSKTLIIQKKVLDFYASGAAFSRAVDDLGFGSTS